MTESETPEAGAPVEAEEETGSLVFEQPLNERMRTFLRVDFLYNQALYHNEIASQWGSRAAMGSLIDILAITTRGDRGSLPVLPHRFPYRHLNPL